MGRPRCTQRRHGSAIPPSQHRPGRSSPPGRLARLLETAPGCRQGCRAGVAGIAAGDRASADTQTALDAVLEADVGVIIGLAVASACRISGMPTRSRPAVKGPKSTSRSPMTGKLRNGSRRKGRPGRATSASGVTQASRSRPLMRSPQLPHEAWWQEWRKSREGSCFSISSRISNTYAEARQGNRESPASPACAGCALSL